ncbi:hypothetical protein [Pseudomonas peli]|uniref:hypothetical protein n=1 Tax=Pseudomonas peli TaxID=592361 RepID=UPI0024AD70FE|nr:hypothetical protein [Pseudomonas peli]
MRHSLVLSAIIGHACWPPAPSQAANNSLVFCSEGSPAGFDTAQYTTATDNDAAEPLYNRLVEFERRDQRAYRAWPLAGIYSEDGLTYTFHLREGGEVPHHALLQAEPRLQRRRRAVHLQSHARPGHPFRKAYPTEFPYFNGMSLNKNIAKVEKPTR